MFIKMKAVYISMKVLNIFVQFVLSKMMFLKIKTFH